MIEPLLVNFKILIDQAVLSQLIVSLCVLLLRFSVTATHIAMNHLGFNLFVEYIIVIILIAVREILLDNSGIGGEVSLKKHVDVVSTFDDVEKFKELEQFEH